MPATPAARTYTSFIESNANADTSMLRESLNEHGYLFFRALVPSDEVLRVRRAVLELCDEVGWLDPARDLMDGIFCPGSEPTMEGRPDYMKVYRKVLRTPCFHDFPLHRSLMQVARIALGVPQDQVLVHPRRIGRISFPRMIEATTPPHQDHFYIRGAVDTYSCWTPLGTCPQELGGLAVAPGSHKNGYREHPVHSTGIGGCGVEIDDAQTDWHTTDFGIGDALFFHSYTIHKALPNLTDDRLRLSTDNRYQRSKETIEPDALLPHLSEIAE